LGIIEQECKISKGVKRIFAEGRFNSDLCCIYCRIWEG
jgi:hypothetical protein